jgi:hypothetical protein
VSRTTKNDGKTKNIFSDVETDNMFGFYVKITIFGDFRQKWVFFLKSNVMMSLYLDYLSLKRHFFPPFLWQIIFKMHNIGP